MYEKWKEQYEKTISKFPERKKVFKTTSGYVVKPFYTPADIPDFDYEKNLASVCRLCNSRRIK